MKSVILGMVLANSLYSDNKQNCNQEAYDDVYYEIVSSAIAETITIDERNELINKLRYLCKGQLSSFETGGTYVRPNKRKKFKTDSEET